MGILNSSAGINSVVIAPDSFKGSMSARDVAENIAAGWRSVRPGDQITLIPQADGGEGTLDAIEASVPGAVRRTVGSVTGPDGHPTAGVWLELPGGVAVVELAQCSGLPLMRGLDPLGATTRGLGEVIRSAIESGATSVIIGLGGSATTDGGAGALAALGLSLTDSAGRPIADGGAALVRLATANRSAMIAAPAGGVILLSDVVSPLLGETGAAAIFGPQKGASHAQVLLLDAALARFAAVLGGDTRTPGSGAAGGAGFGFTSVWGATILPGADYLATLSGLTEVIARADVLVTGEGRFDSQSLEGKVVGQLLSLAARHAVRAGIIAGQVTAETTVWIASLTELAGSAEAAIADPGHWLREAGAQSAVALCASRNS